MVWTVPPASARQMCPYGIWAETRSECRKMSNVTSLLKPSTEFSSPVETAQSDFRESANGRVPLSRPQDFNTTHWKQTRVDWWRVEFQSRFSDLAHLLESSGFRLLRENYRKPGHDKLIRIDFHGPKEVPTGTCHSILKAAGIKLGRNYD